MSLKSSNPLDTIKNLANEELAGYSDEELYKIEHLYDIVVDGELRSFLKLAGKCSGGAIGDQEMLFYRGDMNIRSHLIFQSKTIERIRDINTELLCIRPMKPFAFAVVGESKIYLLKTAAEDSQQVYCYDQSHNTFKEMEWSFLDYVDQQILSTSKSKKNHENCSTFKGNLLLIFSN